MQTPFNPIVIPKLAAPVANPTTPAVTTAPAVKPSRQKPAARKTTRVAKTKRAVEAPRPVVRLARKVRRQVRRLSQRIKGGLQARLGHLDRDKLKRVLISCGVAAAVATTIVVLVKLTPLIVTLLALLGLGAVLQLWAKLRSTRLPA